MPAPAFAVYGRNEFQLAVDRGIVGATFQPLPIDMVRKEMKRSEARTVARVHQFLKDPKLPVPFNSYSRRRLFLTILFNFQVNGCVQCSVKGQACETSGLGFSCVPCGKAKRGRCSLAAPFDERLTLAADLVSRLPFSPQGKLLLPFSFSF